MTKRIIFVSLTLLLYLIALLMEIRTQRLEVRIKTTEIQSQVSEPQSVFQEIYIEDFVNKESSGMISHVSSIAPLDKDRLLCVWYSGSREGAKDVAIFMAIYNEKNGTWTIPLKLIDRETASRELKRYVKKIGNPMLMRDNSGKIWLFYSTVIAGGWSGSSINYKTTTDAISWTESKKLLLSPFFNLTHNVKNDGINLNDGSFIIPAYSELFNKNSSIIQVDPGHETFRIYRITAAEKIIQPVLLPLGEDKLLIFFRNSKKKGERFIPFMEMDLIKHRESPLRYTELPNPDSGFDMIRTEDNSILAVINNSFNNRENLSIFLSSDNGSSWRLIKVLESSQGKEYSYPSITKSLNGFYHITYTYERKRIKHVMFNEIWLWKQKAGGKTVENRSQKADNRTEETEEGQRRKGISNLSFISGMQTLISLSGCFLIILVLMKYLVRITGLKDRIPFIIIIVSSIIMIFIPFGTLSLKDLILSMNPWFSTGSIVFLLYLLFQKREKGFFQSKGIMLFSLWTFSISIILFLSIYDFVGLDIYSYGYNFSYFAPPIFLLNMIFAISGNPLSFAFNIYILSFISGLPPSQNIFDSITDGLAFILSTGIILSNIFRIGSQRS